MTLALVVVFGAYAVVMGVLAARTWVPRPTARFAEEGALPTVALVVAARDEEACIERCLGALLAQDYPADKVTVVVADDHSQDGTAEVVRRAIARYDGPFDVRYLRVPDPTDHVRGKAQALDAAFAATDAELVLITDADCAPVPTWARTLAHPFADPDLGVACGVARVQPRRGVWFDRVQALDWSILLASVSASAELGAPPSGMGNAMAVRTAAYRGVGGYRALPFSVTEDFTLVRALYGDGWGVRFPPSRESVVWTLPADGPGATYEQRRRWARGPIGLDPFVIPLYLVLWSVHALLLAALVVAPAAGLAALGVKTVSDGALLAAMARRVGGRVRPDVLIGFEAWVAGYLLTLPVVLATRPRVGWKGRRH